MTIILFTSMTSKKKNNYGFGRTMQTATVHLAGRGQGEVASTKPEPIAIDQGRDISVVPVALHTRQFWTESRYGRASGTLRCTAIVENVSTEVTLLVLVPRGLKGCPVRTRVRLWLRRIVHHTDDATPTQQSEGLRVSGTILHREPHPRSGVALDDAPSSSWTPMSLGNMVTLLFFDALPVAPPSRRSF